MTPLLEPIRWMALGAALAKPEFAGRLVDYVGSRAFQGPSSGAYISVEGFLGGFHGWDLVLYQELCGIMEGKKLKEDGVKFSDFLIRTLNEEAESAWMIQDADPDQRRMLELSNDIAQKAALLAAWAKRMRQ